MRKLRLSASVKKASTDSSWTVPKTSAVVVPFFNNSSKKNRALSAAYCGSLNG